MSFAEFRRPVPLYWISFVLVGLSLSLLGPALVELRERSGANIAAVGVVFVAQAFGYLFGSFVGGRYFDRLNPHHVYATALILMGAGLGVVPSLSSMVGWFAAFVVVGVGAAICDVGANTLLLWELGVNNVRAMNVLHLCFGIGALSAPLLVDLSFTNGLRMVAVSCVLLAGWSLAVTAPVLPSARPDHHPDQSPRLLGFLAAFFLLYVGAEVTFSGWIHTYALERGLGDTRATWLTTTFWIGFTFGRLVASGAAHLVRPKVLLASACLLTVVAAIALVGVAGNLWALFAVSAALGLAMAPQFPVMLSYLERRIHVTGAATSWFIAGAGVGSLIIPWMVGRWLDDWGAGALPIAILGLSLVTFGSFVLIDRMLGG